MLHRFETPFHGVRWIGVLLAFVALEALPAYGQTGSVSGRVIDATDGLPLAGANVLVFGGNGVMVTGAATGEDGTYRIVAVPAGSYRLQARFLGFQEYETQIRVSGGETVSVDVSLSATGFELNTVVITGSRREEKVLEAPASMSVLTSEDVTRSVGSSSIEALRNTTGVDMAQTGIDRREVVLRGFNNAFSGAAYVLTDYRHAAVASLAVNIYSIMPNMNVDVDRVEVVRGPGSALYGAGVDSGVIHFISKDPFAHPGTTVSLSAGERNFVGLQFRHAGVLGARQKLGYKITGMLGQADDWAMDPHDPIDAVQLQGDVVPRNPDYNKSNVNGTLEYRFSDRGSVIASGGYSNLDATVLSGIGTLQAENFGYSYGQLRFQYDRFFAQAYFNKNRAGGSFVYDQDFDGDDVPDGVTDHGIMYNVQAQYDFDLGRNQNFIAGVDVELTRPSTEGTILGRNEDNDQVSEYGAYIQSLTRITPKLDLTLALRGDHNNVVDKFQVSPRAALVVKPVDGHSFRVTYNRAFSSPSTNSNFLDIIAATSPLTVRARGSAYGFTWERDQAGNLLATSLLPNRLGQAHAVGAPLDAIYELVYAGIAAIPTATLTALLQQQGLMIDQARTADLVQFLSPSETTVAGLSPGVLALPNLTTGQTEIGVPEPVDVRPLEQTITQTIEIGYKGLFSNRLLVTIDAYWTNKKDFVGPLLLESPLVITPNLANDLTGALATGIQGNAQLAEAIAQMGLTPAQVAAIVVGFAEEDLPAAVGIVQAVENDPGVGVAPEMMLTYRNFGNLSYTGVDVAFEFAASDRVSVFGNASWVSDDFFDETELDEEGTGLELALNASALKGRLGVSYETGAGLSVSVAGRYTDGFPIASGPYVGDLPEYTVLDLNVGYDLGAHVPGLRLDLGIANVLDERHREFIGAPQMGRLGMLRATYSF
jgi:iron complex outermembrane receptor protein